MQRNLLRPGIFAALLAAFTLVAAQMGALTHGWSHVSSHDTAHPAHGNTAHVGADAEHHPDDGHPEQAHVALCELCAHFAAVLQVPATPSGSTFVAAEDRWEASQDTTTRPPAADAFHYPARAPPFLLI